MGYGCPSASARAPIGAGKRLIEIPAYMNAVPDGLSEVDWDARRDLCRGHEPETLVARLMRKRNRSTEWRPIYAATGPTTSQAQMPDSSGGLMMTRSAAGAI